MSQHSQLKGEMRKLKRELEEAQRKAWRQAGSGDSVETYTEQRLREEREGTRQLHDHLKQWAAERPQPMAAMRRLFWRFHWADRATFVDPGLYWCGKANTRLLALPQAKPRIEMVEFPEQTLVIAKDQPEYAPAPAHFHPTDETGRMTFKWKLNWAARWRVFVTGTVWHSVLTFQRPLQPQEMHGGDKPAFVQGKEAAK